MSLPSFLVNPATNVDAELDSLFKQKPSIPLTPITTEPTRKRKLVEQKHDAHHKRLKPDVKVTQENGDENEPPEVEKEDKDSDDPSNLVHESLKSKSKSKSTSKKRKYAPPDETPARRDQRTIFIGNLSLQVAQSRPLQKKLQRHILSFVPTARIESIRFRSVPFSSPSSNPTSNTSTSTDAQPHKNPSKRSHDRDRASTWRSSTTDDGDPSSSQKDTKTYLTPNQKKKYLFLTHQFHNTGVTIHAYIVFAHPPPLELLPHRSVNASPVEPVLNPYEAVKEVVKMADGSEFEGQAIRVDFVGGTGAKKGEEGGGDEKAFKDADPKLTLFVGNLDFGSQDEDLRIFFESLMKKERSDLPTREDDESINVKKQTSWVTHVRIIRDKDTQLGKGFAYVQFFDRECVDEILTLDATQLKFAKRKLRVQRCKTLPGVKLSASLKSQLSSKPNNKESKSTNKESHLSSSASTPKSATAHRVHVAPKPIEIPKGDPSLGTKLASLSKSERKAAKASNADRVARRLAKKKARMAMGTSKDRTPSAKDGGNANKNKIRERPRKSGGGLGGDGKKKAKDVKKSRVRSERNLEKRNAKK